MMRRTRADVSLDSTSREAAPTSSGRDWLELVATFLLAFAAVATAWASYQATRWNGEQARAASRTNALRIEAARAASQAESETQIDVATFIQWIDAWAADDGELQQFYLARFRAEFAIAFDTWLATDPFTDPSAPPTPFAMDSYRLAARADVERLDQESERSAAVVNRSIQRAAEYVLAVVLFAAALFFAGISTKLRGTGVRIVTLGVGCVMFVGTAIWVATLPAIVSL